MSFYRKPLFWLAVIVVFTSMFYYYPNFFVSGGLLYKWGLENYTEGDHGDYYDWDKMRRAAFYFEKAIDKGIIPKGIYQKLAQCYWNIGDKKKSEKTDSLAICKYPKDIGFYTDRAECRKALKDAKGAFEDFDMVIKLSPSNKEMAGVYYDRGAMRFVLGDTTGANADRQKVKLLVGSGWRTYQDYTHMLGFDAN